MSIKTEVENTAKYLREAYVALEDKGATVAGDKNMANLAGAVQSIKAGGSTVFTLEAFCNALDTSLDSCMKKYPVGTRLDDTYDGQSDPLVVAMYTSSSVSGYTGTKAGAFLIRQYAFYTPDLMFDPEGSMAKWNDASPISQFLNNEYLNKCSDKLKERVTSVLYPAYSSTGITAHPWSISSAVEVMGASMSGDGTAWDFWKQVVMSTSTSDTANSNRICYDRDSKVVKCWLRTHGGSLDQACCIDSDGSVYRRQASFSTTNMGVRPICFIGRDTSIKEPSTNPAPA